MLWWFRGIRSLGRGTMELSPKQYIALMEDAHAGNYHMKLHRLGLTTTLTHASQYTLNIMPSSRRGWKIVWVDEYTPPQSPASSAAT